MKDSYVWQARILPAIAFMLPFYIETNYLMILLKINITLPSLITNLVLSLAIVVLSNYCRYQGKKKEPLLFNKWGGEPTTRFLRYSNAEYNFNNKKMVKSYWKATLFDVSIPSEEYEKKHPQEADLAYSAFVSKLRADSRSSKMFPLLQAENKNYGMWRNLYGIKTSSIIICVIFIFLNVCLTVFFPDFLSLKNFFILSGVHLLIFFLWLTIVSESKVKQAAESYAERLFEICYTNRERLKEESGGK